MSTSVQAINLPILYKNNLQVAWASNTTLTVQAGQARNSDNNFDITTAAVTVDSAVNGLNGLDTGSLAASTWYAVLQIGSSLNTQIPGFILTKLSTVSNPVLPFDYDINDVVGYWLTDGSSHFINGYVVGNGNSRQHIWDNAISVLSSGTASTATAVDLSAAVPPIQNTLVLLNAEHGPASAGGYVTFTAGDSAATLGGFVVGSVSSVANSAQIEVLARLVSGAPKIKYTNSAASGSTSAWVQSFKYFV